MTTTIYVGLFPGLRILLGHIVSLLGYWCFPGVVEKEYMFENMAFCVEHLNYSNLLEFCNDFAWIKSKWNRRQQGGLEGSISWKQSNDNHINDWDGWSAFIEQNLSTNRLIVRAYGSKISSIILYMDICNLDVQS